MRNRKSGAGAFALGAALAALAAGAGAARADEAREKELENRVQDLEKRLEEVASSVRGGYFSANSELEARISELERMAADDKGGLNTYFKNGLKMESGDKAFSYSVYGRIQNDWNWWNQDVDREIEDEIGDLNGGTNFRRVRVGVSGAMYGNVKFKSEFDFANSSVEFADVFMELTNCGFGTFRVGHFDEPFSMDRLTSSRFSTFVERNFIETFAPGRNTGMMVYGNALEDMLTYQVGMFRDADVRGADTNNEKTGEYNFTARLAGRPLVEDDGATWLHLGAAVSYRDFSDDGVSYSARPGVRVGTPSFVSQSLSDIDDGTLLGLEGAFVTGPFTFKAEYALASGNGTTIEDDDGISTGESADDYDFDAISIEASMWLTGDSSTYDKTAARFDRPKIKKNFGDGEGIGAWQLALGYDKIDLTDGDYEADPTDIGTIKQSDMDMWRVGVNWWLNPNTRVSLNVIRADQEEFDDEVTAVVMRFQIDF